MTLNHSSQGNLGSRKGKHFQELIFRGRQGQWKQMLYLLEAWRKLAGGSLAIEERRDS